MYSLSVVLRLISQLISFAMTLCGVCFPLLSVSLNVHVLPSSLLSLIMCVDCFIGLFILPLIIIVLVLSTENFYTCIFNRIIYLLLLLPNLSGFFKTKMGVGVARRVCVFYFISIVVL